MNLKALFSSAGLAAIAVALVIAVAVISLLPSLRIDLTEDSLYTLSDGTRNIVSNLTTPQELTFFYSESATEDQPQIRAYGNRVQELLREIVIASNGNLTLSVVDPEPFSEDEDLATQYGIRAVPVSQGGIEIYFGLVVTQDIPPEDINPLAPPPVETMPLIRPDQEQFLEYEFMKLITNVENPDRTVIGLITQLDIDGGFNPATGQATPSWFVMDMLRQLYEVRRLDADAETIDEDIDILMLVHPNDLSDQMLYAIDQHVLAGGEAMVFLDPNADSMVTLSQQGALIPAGMNSNLPGLLEAWGIEYQDDKVLTDSDLALRVRMSQTERPVPHLGMLGAKRDNLARGDIITNRLESVNFSTPGVLSPIEGAGTTFEPLITSSTNSMLMDRILLESVTDPSILFDEFESSNESHVIAARISGLVETAFPDGRPVVPVEEAEEETEEQAADEDATADAAADSDNPAQPDEANADVAEESEETVPHLQRSQAPVNLIVFADTDLLTDRLWVQVAQFLGQRIPQPFANNGDLIINAFDNLSGGADLVSIRSRGTYSRPFTRVVDLQRQADDRLRLEEAELLDRMTETEEALAQLNQDENGNPIGQITPEIQAEVDRFNQELLDTRRRLRDVQFQLTEDIDRLGTNLTMANTILVPALLTIIALMMHFARVRRRRATA
ncbi:MAG: GldG family protein [Proteobacteria bacterium]|nr:GldG family protein [Pseudomonadota bacterium]MDA0927238.1 GldG family protein [Pseudomonadota bacterium]